MHEAETLEALIRHTGLFDEQWYVALYPEVVRSKSDPLEHYLSEGIREHLSPHPFFSPQFYLAFNADVAASNLPPLVHYLNHGGKEWRAPNPFVDMDRYYEHYRDSVQRTKTGTLAEDFLKSRDRSRAFQFFDADYYRKQAELEDAPFNHLLNHFLKFGLLANDSPHPLIQMNRLSKADLPMQRYKAFLNIFKPQDEAEFTSLHPMFDNDHYLQQAGSIDTHPIVHYLRSWRYNPMEPHPLFDADLAQRKLKKLSNVEPTHDPLTLFTSQPDWETQWPNAYFDPVFYTKNFGKHFRANDTAIEHYMRWGHMHWFEPSEKFGQRYYLSRHPEVAESGMPALVHFLKHGVKSGASPLPPKPFFDPTRNLQPEAIVDLIKAIPQRPNTPPKVSVIIPVYQNIHFTLRCVWSALSSHEKTSFEILVIDDKSPDGSGGFLAHALNGVPNVKVHLNTKNLGFLRTCNHAASITDAPYLFFLNNDTAVLDGWLDELVDTFGREKKAGLVGSKLIYPNGLLQEAGGIVWEGGGGANYGKFDDPAAPQFNYQRDVDYISGAAILVPRKYWDAVGGFSDELAPAYYEDTDLAMKLRAKGLRTIYQPMSTIVHFEGISSGTDLGSGVKKYQVVNKEKFNEKWGGVLARMGNQGDLSRKNVDRLVKGRILVYDNELPKPDKDSGSITAFFMLQLLCELGYRVTFVPQNLEWDGKYATALQRLGVEVIHRPYVRDAQQYVLDNGDDVDMFILSRAPIGGAFFGRLKEAFPEKPIVFDTVDIHHLRMQRQYELSGEIELLQAANEMKALELGVLRNADVTMLVSDYEVDYLRKEIGPFPYLVLPLIYEPFERLTDFADRRDVAFVGGYRHPPNIDAVKYLVEEIWPRMRDLDIDAKLHIIGSHMPPEFAEYAADDIIIVGFVEDLEAYLQNIRLTIAPLRYGAGVKGKVGNSLRMGVPVIGTPIATEGMGLIDGEHVLTSQDAQGLAEHVRRAYTDRVLWEKLSTQGQAFVQDSFGLAAAKTKLRSLVRAVLPSQEANG